MKKFEFMVFLILYQLLVYIGMLGLLMMPFYFIFSFLGFFSVDPALTKYIKTLANGEPIFFFYSTFIVNIFLLPFDILSLYYMIKEYKETKNLKFCFDKIFLDYPLVFCIINGLLYCMTFAPVLFPIALALIYKYFNKKLDKRFLLILVIIITYAMFWWYITYNFDLFFRRIFYLISCLILPIIMWFIV
jgi:hypothetical protein